MTLEDEFLWTLAVARLVFGAKMSVQTPPNLAPRLIGERHRGRHRRLGRHLPGDAGLRQSGGAVAAGRCLWPPSWRGTGACWWRGCRSIRVMPTQGGDGSIARCAGGGATRATRMGWRGPTPGRRGAGPPGCGAEDGDRLGRSGVRPPSRRCRGDRFAAVASRDRHAVRGARRRFRAGLRGRRSPARPRRRRYRDLRRQPQHQLHQCVLLPLRLLRLFQGQVGRPSARPPPTISTTTRSPSGAEAWARGATEVCLQGGIHPTTPATPISRSCAR